MATSNITGRKNLRIGTAEKICETETAVVKQSLVGEFEMRYHGQGHERERHKGRREGTAKL